MISFDNSACLSGNSILGWIFARAAYIYLIDAALDRHQTYIPARARFARIVEQVSSLSIRET